MKSGNAWQSRERAAINASRYIRFDISAHDFRSRNREARRARHTDGAERRMACARRDGYTPNLFEVWRCRRDLERDSRSLSGKDDGWLFVGRDAFTYEGPSISYEDCSTASNSVSLFREIIEFRLISTYIRLSPVIIGRYNSKIFQISRNEFNYKHINCYLKT